MSLATLFLSYTLSHPKEREREREGGGGERRERAEREKERERVIDHVIFLCT